MQISTLLARNLTWYWRTNLAVVLGVATATGVLAGALLVGDSVRASLRDLVLSRLGNTDSIVTRDGFFREQLAAELGDACPMIAMQGVAAHEPSGRRAMNVQVYGVDERFWKFQGEAGEPPKSREILLTAALAQEFGGKADDTILLRVQKPSAIPLESLHGRKEDVGKSIRLLLKGVVPRDFALQPQQGDVRAVFVPLSRLQRELAQAGKINTILAAQTPNLKQHYRLEDAGLKLRHLEGPDCWSLETDSGVIGDALADVASSTAKSPGLRTEAVSTYLANSMRVGDREVPYSLVTALDAAPAPTEPDGITLNDWTAKDLAAKVGDSLMLEYYVWKSDGRLHTSSAQFRISQIVAIAGTAADRDFAPDYPGITESDNLHDWDPPFPLDLKRVRPLDEQYWARYRTTPKAFIPLARGREIWGTRFGSLTSIRIFPPSPAFENALREAIDPSKMGMTIIPAKALSLAAAQGATDFGEYFIYFSFFLMVSALLLTGLFFKLGVEQRMREIGVLRALGFATSKIRTLFLLEGAAISVVGAVLGIGVALAYGELILYGLRTWWVDAVGTRLLTLHASSTSLGLGAVAGIITSLCAIAWTVRRVVLATPRSLVASGAGWQPAADWQSAKRSLITRPRLGAFLSLLAAILLVAAWKGALDQTAGFFGAGVLLLIAALLLESAWLRSRGFAAVSGQVTLGLRSAAYRPGRSILCIALIASATFLIVSLDAFRREGSSEGTGGFPLMAESALPLIHDPNTETGREALNLPLIDGVQFTSFRLRPGDDASCLNLYQPRNPRVLGAPAAFLHGARFASSSWPLLESKLPDGAVPAIADANSLTYALHLKVGDDLVLNGIRFRIVGALEDSLFQSELLISEDQFLRIFPDQEGYQFFLLDVPPGKAEQITGALESSLSDYGFDVQSTQARLAGYHRVENTYLSTFRALGELGLLLGTVGLAAIVLRNVLERRKELALLRAVGYRHRHLAAMVLAENVLLLGMGLATGAACALLAVAPAVAVRGGHFPVASLAALLAVVFAVGVSASFAATSAALRSPLLAALRSE